MPLFRRRKKANSPARDAPAAPNRKGSGVKKAAVYGAIGAAAFFGGGELSKKVAAEASNPAVRRHALAVSEEYTAAKRAIGKYIDRFGNHFVFRTIALSAGIITASSVAAGKKRRKKITVTDGGVATEEEVTHDKPPMEGWPKKAVIGAGAAAGFVYPTATISASVIYGIWTNMTAAQRKKALEKLKAAAQATGQKARSVGSRVKKHFSNGNGGSNPPGGGNRPSNVRGSNPRIAP